MKALRKALFTGSSTGTRIAAIDLDGTLLDEQKQISPENAQAVASLIAHGFTIVLTTGRVYQHTLPYYRQLGLTGPVVTSDGASVRIPGRKTIRGRSGGEDHSHSGGCSGDNGTVLP
jgi:HAD superfamily hydrolase (TIGR01484 family)